MDTLAKSDMFFFITSIAVVLFTIVTALLGVYLFGIVSDIKQITKRLKEETDEVMDDLKAARESLKDKGRSIGSILGAIFALRGRSKRKKKESEE